MIAQRTIVPVILCGGTGTRLWPLSREAFPKQFLPVKGERTLLQQTLQRTAASQLFAKPTVITNEDHRFIVAEQIRAAGLPKATIVVEPVGRNTAPAAAVAAHQAHEKDPEALLLIAPADHFIADADAFVDTIARAVPVALSGQIVLFGITPTGPVTGYGYIRRGMPVSDGAFEVAEFVEKPALADAEAYIASGNYLWNGGIFLVTAARLLEEFDRHAPDIARAASAALITGEHDLDFLRLGRDAFAQAPSISLDYAIMERADRVVVMPLTCGWSDLGTWSSLYDAEPHDADGVVTSGAAVADDCRSCYLRGEGPLVAAVGVENLIVVATNDVVLVARKDADQDVKRLVQKLKSEGLEAAVTSRRVHRPWGFYESIERGERFQVKRITVNPGAQLSLQKHYHRAEHWVVVNGTALVTKDHETLLVRENESIYLPLGTVHRLANPGKVPLNLIEVQSGAYLGEDDIVRIEDIYQRV